MKSVFISSTFKDMQSERDYLHQFIFPRLRKLMAKYGQDIQELDLRWGVDTMHMTEEESGHEVIRVCIDAIDRCRPFLIVLLGERYGWIPDQEILKSVNDKRVEDTYVSDSSITDLEIRYGALNNQEAFENTIFCFRNASIINEMEEEYRWMYTSESEVHASKLNHLKEAIINQPNVKTINYNASWDKTTHKVIGLEEFGEQIFNMLSDLIHQEFSHLAPVSSYEQLQNEMKQIQENYLSTYIPRYKEEYQILSYVHEYFKNFDPHRIIYLKGHAGSGKSAIMSYVATVLKNAPSPYPHLLYFSGGPGAQNVDTLKEILLQTLENELGIESKSPNESINMRLTHLNNQIRVPFVVFIDAIDQLFEGVEDIQFDLCQLCPKICFVISYLDTFDIKKVQNPGFKHKTIEVSSLNKQQILHFIEATSKKRGKKLDDEVINHLLELDEATNPLYLSMVLQRFFMMDAKEFQSAESLAPGMNGLHLYMSQLLAQMPETTKEMIRYLLSESSLHFNMTDFTFIMQLLASSNIGLSEHELEETFAFDNKVFMPIKYQQMISYLYDAFSQRQNGKWYFNHRLFYEAIKEDMTEQEKKIILDTFIQLTLQNQDFLNSEGYYYLLNSHHPQGYLAFENLYEETKPKFMQFIANFILDNQHFEYLLGLIKKHDSINIYNFWLKEYNYSLYSPQREEQVYQVLISILSHPNRTSKQIIDMITALLRNILTICTLDELSTIISIYEKQALDFTPYQQMIDHYLIARYQHFQDLDAINEIEKAYEISRNFDQTNDDAVIQINYWNIRLHSKIQQVVLLDQLNEMIEILKQNNDQENLARFLYLRFSTYPNYSNFDANIFIQYFKEAESYLKSLIKETPTYEFYELLTQLNMEMQQRLQFEYRYPYFQTLIPLYKKLYEISPIYSYEYNAAWVTVSCARSKWFNKKIDREEIWNQWLEGLALYDKLDKEKAKEAFTFYITIFAEQLLSEEVLTHQDSLVYYLNRAIEILTTQLDLTNESNLVTLIAAKNLLIKFKDMNFEYQKAAELLEDLSQLLKKVQPTSWVRRIYLKSLTTMIMYAYHSRCDKFIAPLISLYESQFQKDEDSFAYYETNYIKARLALENKKWEDLNHLLTTSLNINITDHILYQQKLTLLKAEAAYKQNNISLANSIFYSLMNDWKKNSGIYPKGGYNYRLYKFYQAYSYLVYGDLLREHHLDTDQTKKAQAIYSKGKYDYITYKSYGGSEYAKAYEIFKSLSYDNYKEVIIQRIESREKDSEEFTRDKYNIVRQMNIDEVIKYQYLIKEALQYSLLYEDGNTTLWKSVCCMIMEDSSIKVHQSNRQLIAQYFFLMGYYDLALKWAIDSPFKKLLLAKMENNPTYLKEIKPYIDELKQDCKDYVYAYQILVYYELKVRTSTNKLPYKPFSDFIQAAKICKNLHYNSINFEDHWLIIQLLLDYKHLDYLNNYDEEKLSILAYYVHNAITSIEKQNDITISFSQILNLEYEFILTKNHKFNYVGIMDYGEYSILSLYPHFKHLCTNDDLLTLINIYKELSPTEFYNNYASIRKEISVDYLACTQDMSHLCEIEEFLMTHNKYNDFILDYRFSNTNDLFFDLYKKTNNLQWLEVYYKLITKKNVLQEISIEDSHYLENLITYLPHHKEDIELALNRVYEVNAKYLLLHINYYADHYQKKPKKQLHEYYKEFYKIRTNYLKDLRSIF